MSKMLNDREFEELDRKARGYERLVDDVENLSRQLVNEQGALAETEHYFSEAVELLRLWHKYGRALIVHHETFDGRNLARDTEIWLRRVSKKAAEPL